ncbi:MULTISPECIES: homoserine kinase [unclassified Crossiella]|uniref:homoserine kinase n=1 Tax=unclassified Crossiella TaxID=2620835 RepID=UPI001FFE7C1F|nr:MULTISPECIES: homoserine kinase [unclassified Crossiella]MCK2244947.1 homoserine kinase [Crossiella sp. S99.2]MCK2258500.1 homoserine kinase [Crossiella sp. S99.1]
MLVRIGSGVRVTVPASTANLGSGFDSLGLALGLYDEVEVRVAPAGEIRVRVEGQGAGRVPTDERHLVVRAVRSALSSCGVAGLGLDLVCRNRIPHARGLGSSAAAAVAGVAAGFALADRELDDGVLQLAAEFEGHADNAAASVYGGIVIAWQDGKDYQAIRLEPHEELAPLVFVPETESETKTTRGLLPEQVPLRDAAFAAGRSALAVYALTTDPWLLLPGTADRLHQEYRRPAFPATMALVDSLRAAGIPAMVSGAGPTVIAFPRGGHLPDEADLSGFTPMALPIDQGGVVVEPIGGSANPSEGAKPR